MDRAFRFPDRPCTASVGILDTLEERDWIAQTKYDGQRALVHWDGARIFLASRHNEPLPATAALLGETADILRMLPPILLDGEWMAQRDIQPESLWLFDLLSVNGDWRGDLPALERFEDLFLLVGARTSARVRVVEAADHGYVQFFEQSKARARAEGIVLKHKDSKFIGSICRSVDNPRWIRVDHEETGGEAPGHFAPCSCTTMVYDGANWSSDEAAAPSSHR